MPPKRRREEAWSRARCGGRAGSARTRVSRSARERTGGISSTADGLSGNWEVVEMVIHGLGKTGVDRKSGSGRRSTLLVRKYEGDLFPMIV
ncbi:hypothetical protein GCM10007856_15690 [Azospirillum oryzae]|nr:hypothetical protein GCM10007856_15690 [Azospirillum oryzae]